MRRSSVLFALCAANCWAQLPAISPEAILLSGIRAGMQHALQTQPDYTCVQRIERSERRIPRRPAELVDTLRLEVALINGRELFAWPGAKSFDDISLSQRIGTGAIADGSFALHARAVFLDPGPTFEFRGEEAIEDRRAVRFNYRVARESSHYRLRVNSNVVVVPYHGSIWADAETLDVIRLNVVADELPGELGLQRVENSVEYTRRPIGRTDYLFPTRSELSLVDRAGRERHNVASFASCRQYAGESVVSFVEPAPEATAAENTPAPEPDRPAESVPANLYAEVELKTEIDSARSATGDLVEALLAKPLRQKHRVLIPSGTMLEGRIVRLERRDGNCFLNVQFTEAKAKHSRWNLLARIHDLRSHAPQYSGDALERAMFSKRPPQAGTMCIRGTTFHLPRGFRMTLRTETIAAARGTSYAAAQESQ